MHELGFIHKEVIFGTSCLEAPLSKILFKLIKRKVFLEVLIQLRNRVKDGRRPVLGVRAIYSMSVNSPNLCAPGLKIKPMRIPVRHLCHLQLYQQTVRKTLAPIKPFPECAPSHTG